MLSIIQPIVSLLSIPIEPPSLSVHLTLLAITHCLRLFTPLQTFYYPPEPSKPPPQPHTWPKLSANQAITIHQRAFHPSLLSNRSPQSLSNNQNFISHHITSTLHSNKQMDVLDLHNPIAYLAPPPHVIINVLAWILVMTKMEQGGLMMPECKNEWAWHGHWWRG